MGKIGFILNIEFENNIEQENLLFNNKKLNKNKKNIIVFLEKENLKGNYLISKKSFFKKEESIYVFMNKYSDLEEFLIFDNSTFKLGKISVSQKTIIDFKHLTFWFNSKKYREIFELLSLNDFEVKNNNLDNMIKERTIKLLKYFNF